MADALPTLEQLLALCAGGDKRAFGEFYQRTSTKLFGVALGIAKDRGIAEDILQQGYVRIWKYASSFDPTSASPIAWAAAIVRNVALDELRKAGRIRPVSWTDAEGDPLDRIADPVEAPAPWQLQALRRCLESLEPMQRNCVLLAYYEGYSREDLSERFDRPVGTIKTWLHRGLNSLKACLGR
ncbi:MAG: sigma-70 family RNA polymerase sigma factor [Hyphomicrobiaceae bacterium]|nr:sigma-70 family RNA polymerase sigma factor [Hyphomicrobiaceae bacterium]